MDKDRALQIIREHLPDKRYVHTIGVTNTALILAKRYGVDEHKVMLASVFHDYAKFRPIKEMVEIVKGEQLPEDLLYYGNELLHGPVGAILVKNEVGITDEEILNAISYHTTGRVGMSLVEKIVFLADYIEPGRRFPGVDEVREMAKEDLDGAIIKALANTIAFLMSKKQLVYPETLATYNDLIRKKKVEV